VALVAISKTIEALKENRDHEFPEEFRADGCTAALSAVLLSELYWQEAEETVKTAKLLGQYEALKAHYAQSATRTLLAENKHEYFDQPEALHGLF